MAEGEKEAETATADDSGAATAAVGSPRDATEHQADNGHVKSRTDAVLTRLTAFGTLLIAIATLVSVLPTVNHLKVESDKATAEIGKVSSEIDTLKAEEEAMNAATAQLAPRFDYQYISVLASSDLMTVGPAEGRGSAVRAWAAPIVSPVFDKGMPPAETKGPYQRSFPHHTDLPPLLASEDCDCPILKSQLEAAGASYSGLKSTYLGVAQLGKVPAVDVRLELRKYHPGELSFFSLEEAEEATATVGEVIEVSLGSLDTGEARLVPLFASVGVSDQGEPAFQTNVGTAYLPVSISWDSGGNDRIAEEIRGALKHPVLLEDGSEARG